MPVTKRIRIGDVLVQKGYITDEQLGRALKAQKTNGMKLGETLIDLGYISEQDMVDVLCDQLNIEYVDLRAIKLDETAVHLIDENIAKKYSVIPIGFDQKNANFLKLAMSDPMDVVAIDDVSIITNMQILPVLATSYQIAVQISKHFGAKQAMEVAERYRREQERERERTQQENDTEENADDVGESPIVQLVDSIIEQAVHRRASDIHIEPMEDRVRLRFRVDGEMAEIMSYDPSLLPVLVSRIKIMSGMDISEKRVPQDGRATAIVDRKDYELRVSSLPTVHGEKIVIRVNAKEVLSRDMSQLGLRDEELTRFTRMLEKPHGIILVSGPTGSGKTTTLYTAISELNKENVNIVTVEDPVETKIDGITQVQVNNKANMTFASALRSILRQDPDIIMIGEIRDDETAEIAVQASITGHLVVSTIHTNSTAATVTRLEDMGIQPYLIADSVSGIIAQRLSRRLCTCKVAYEASEQEKEMLGVPKDQPLTLYKPGGCPKCNNSGYYGRIGVYEVMALDRHIREKISSGGTAIEIEDLARKNGMRTLSDNLRRYVIEGTTTMDELRKKTVEE